MKNASKSVNFTLNCFLVIKSVFHSGFKRQKSDSNHFKIIPEHVISLRNGLKFQNKMHKIWATALCIHFNEICGTVKSSKSRSRQVNSSIYTTVKYIILTCKAAVDANNAIHSSSIAFSWAATMVSSKTNVCITFTWNTNKKMNRR